MHARKTVCLLVGPKGAGKTHIGKVLERRLGVSFLRVEPLFLEVIRLRGRGPGYEEAGFARVAEAIDARLANAECVVIETTGASDAFPDFLESLRARHRVILVAIRTPLGECARRVRMRDSTDHIPVSDEFVAAVNARAARVSLPWDAVLDNAEPASELQIVQTFEKLLPLSP